MQQTTMHLPEELVEAIDDDRIANAQETGNIESRSAWVREAAREKLGIDYEGDGEKADDGSVYFTDGHSNTESEA